MLAHSAWYDYSSPQSVKWDNILAVYLLRQGVEMENQGILEADWEILPVKPENLTAAVHSSFPDWLYDLAGSELGDKWEETAVSINEQAEVFLRVNTLKTKRNKLINKLARAGIPAIDDPRSPDAIRLGGRASLKQLPASLQGLFELQDIASQQVAPLCAVQEGMCIADVCAGAGGKSLHLAALVNNNAEILASDIAENRLDMLRKRADLAGATCIRTVLPEQLGEYQGRCDVVLIDAPCSGTGTIRRQPDTKWKLSPEKLAGYMAKQRELLSQYQTLVKPGGKLVYATCSLLPSENERQVIQFLESTSGFNLLEEVRFWPQEGYDGFYIAVLEKS